MNPTLSRISTYMPYLCSFLMAGFEFLGLSGRINLFDSWWNVGHVLVFLSTQFCFVTTFEWTPGCGQGVISFRYLFCLFYAISAVHVRCIFNFFLHCNHEYV